MIYKKTTNQQTQENRMLSRSLAADLLTHFGLPAGLRAMAWVLREQEGMPALASSLCRMAETVERGEPSGLPGLMRPRQD